MPHDSKGSFSSPVHDVLRARAFVRVSSARFHFPDFYERQPHSTVRRIISFGGTKSQPETYWIF
jgi:hypothetical protein